MIKITIELVPPDKKEKSLIIADGSIINDNKGDKNSANYIFLYTVKDATGVVVNKYEGKIDNIQRGECDIWELIYRTMKMIRKKRRKKLNKSKKRDEQDDGKTV